jgi:multidrug efflux pump
MKTLIDAAFSRANVVILVLIFILIAGAYSYIVIPRESSPDVPIPMVFVSIIHEGISPADSERILVQPMERELQSIEGLKEMSAVAAEGYASITLEFDAGFDSDEALLDVREKVDLARAELPPDTLEPRISEVNVALFPVLSVSLSGPISDRALSTISRNLKNEVEALTNVLEVEIGGEREEMMEVIIEPSTLESYGLSFNDIASLVQRNNQLIAAGALDSGSGRMILKVPGVISELDDVLSMPIKVVGDRVVTFKDIASARRTFKDPESFARIDGQNALVLEITKRSGANIIETIESIQALIEARKASWPASINVTYLLDESVQIKDMLGDLQNNVITAVLLVMIIIIGALGVRPAILVGISIPGSFLAGIMVIYAMGYTLNMVVLFSLILVVGMLVDGAIVTIELAERLKDEGLTKKIAFATAAKRMSWPIIASTATTLSVFIPLLFWPGIVGEFMKYLPITVLITLGASLFMALVFVPVLGGLGKEKASLTDHKSPVGSKSILKTVSNKDKQSSIAKSYVNMLGKLLNHPGKVLLATLSILVGSYAGYYQFGNGVEFFPSTDPNFIQVQVQARGDLSIFEKDELMRNVESRLLGLDSLRAVYTRTAGGGQGEGPADVIGVVQLEFVNWQLRPSADEIIRTVRERLSDLAGIKAQIQEQENGIGGGKPVQIEFTSADYDKLAPAVAQVLELMDEVGGFIDIEDSRALVGIEWELQVDREEAARYGADISLLGSAVQMLTNGMQLAEYQPDDADEELDIRMRFDADSRNMEQLTQLRVPTAAGMVPINNFITFNPVQKTGSINRIDGNRALTIQSEVEEDLLEDDQLALIEAAILTAGLDENVLISFKGEAEDQQEASAFLSKAFGISMVMMLAILLLQFNSFYQSFLVVSAVIFSTVGVMLCLLISGDPFGVVMSGIGVIALAGIVVNNNIVLIDAYNEHKMNPSLSTRERILLTASQRFRPVMLTSITTILGLLPMVFAVSMDVIGQNISIGAPSTQMWTLLSNAIAGGLLFSTVLTLVFTPCMLMLGENVLGRMKVGIRKKPKQNVKHAHKPAVASQT